MRPITGHELATAVEEWSAATAVQGGYLGEVRATVQLQRLLDQALAEAVTDARKRHATWDDVAAAAGISRQGASKRWG